VPPCSDEAPGCPSARADAPASRAEGQAAKSCPSALCREDALLLGVVMPTGRLAYVQPPTRIDAEFVERAKALGHPERRFRFSSTCVEAACPQWTGCSCAVIDHLLDAGPADPAAGDDPKARANAAPQSSATPQGSATPQENATATGRTALPACAIRRTCRWYAQRGPAACAVCPLVVADTGGTATYRTETASPE
jgi:hypothetical protein